MSTTDSFQEIRSGTADAILAGLWRRILKDYDIGPARLGELIHQYSKKMTHLDADKRAQFHGNVLSDLSSDQMTWSTFKRGPMILNASRVTFEFTLHHRACSTEHRFSYEYGPPNEPVEKKDENGKPLPTELSLFLPRVMQELGVSVSIFNELLTNYMCRHKQEPQRGQRMSVRSNVRKDLMQLRLSWAGLMKGFDFLTIPKFEVRIVLEFKGKTGKIRKSTHYERVTINDIEDMLADMDESDFLNPVANLEAISNVNVSE